MSDMDFAGLSQDLGALLTDDRPSPALTRRYGLVTAVAAGPPPTVTLTIGATTGIAGVRFIGPVQPKTNDVVLVAFAGPDPVVIGKIATAYGGANDGQGVFTSGLELYYPTSTPYIDFHNAASAAGDSNADYDVRLILDGAHQLSFASANTSGIVRFFFGGGQWAQIDAGATRVFGNIPFYFQTWGGGWFMQDSTYVRCYGDKIVYTNNEFQGGVGIMGNSPTFANLAEFRNVNCAGGDYAVLQGTADTYVNSPGTLHFRQHNNESINMTGVGVMDWVSGHQPNLALRSDGNDQIWMYKYGGNGVAHTIVDQSGVGIRFWNGTTGVDVWHVTGGSITGGTWAGTGTYAWVCRNGANLFTTNWTGTMQFWIDTTNVKNFVIPHPVEDDRYLIHACVEGPEAAVFYRGEARLDGGWVEVKLPAYFEALCEEDGRSVQLTCIAEDPEDEWCPVLHATYPKGGRFFVGLGSGVVVNDQRFWWEVTARRRGVNMLVEPKRDDVDVLGDGPYTYYRERVA